MRSILFAFTIFVVVTNAAKAQFVQTDLTSFCEESESIRETWLVLDIAGLSAPDGWLEQALPVLRSSLHPRERLKLFMVDSDNRRSFPDNFSECFPAVTDAEVKRLEEGKPIWEKLISDSRNTLRNAQKLFDLKLATAVSQMEEQHQPSEIQREYFSLIYPKIERLRLDNLSGANNKFLRIVFVSFPFIEDNTIETSSSLISYLDDIANKYSVPSMEVYVVATDRNDRALQLDKDDRVAVDIKTDKEPNFNEERVEATKSSFLDVTKEPHNLPKINELAFGKLGAKINFVGSTLDMSAGRRLVNGYAFAGLWKFPDTDGRDTVEIDFYEDNSGRIENGKIAFQSIIGFINVPFSGSYVCKDQNCTLSGAVEHNVPTILSRGAEPVFYENDPIKIDFSESSIIGQLIAGGSKSENSESSNLYILEFE